MSRRYLRPLLLLAGIGVVAYLIVRIGPLEVWSLCRDLSWRLVLILVFPTCLTVLGDTLGWRFTFARPPRPFRRLFGVRLAGEAVNLATPTASVGGDVVKALLLRPSVPLRDAVASIVADKTTSVTSQAVLLLLGLIVAAALSLVSGGVLAVVAGGLAIEILCVAGFVAVQLRGVVGGGGRLLARLGLPLGPERQQALAGTDRVLRSLYAEHGGRLLLSLLCHVAAAAVGTFEIYLFARFLGLDVSVPAAFAIGAFGTGVKFFTFMIPASLGVLEGGNVAIFAAFGLGEAAGLAYTLVRRLREIVWVAAGTAAASAISARPTAPIDRD